MSLSPSYSYGFSMADKKLGQEVDQQGRATGGYSWSMPGGGSASFAYGAGQYVDALRADGVGLNSRISSGPRHGQYHEPRPSDNSLLSYVGTGPAMSDRNVGHHSVQRPRPGQYVGQYVGSTESPESLERYRPSFPRQEMTGVRYNKVPDLTGTGRGQQNPWSSSYPGVNTNTLTSPPSRGESEMTDSSYLMRVLGRDSQWVERSDKVRRAGRSELSLIIGLQEGERSGYYSYLTGQGDTVLVSYTAGRDGFRVLHSQGVPGLDYWGNVNTEY